MPEHQSKIENTPSYAIAQSSTQLNSESTIKAKEIGLKNLPIQYKLKVGANDDPLERQADSVADQVMRMPEQTFIQRKCTSCEEEDKQIVQRKDIAPPIQFKLSIGAVNDSLEQEADQVAATIMNTPKQSFVQRKCESCEEEDKIQRIPTGPQLQHKCSSCEEEEVRRKEITPFIQKKGESAILDANTNNSIQSMRGMGSSLPDKSKNFMENRFSTDFSNVRIHTNSKAENLSASLNAQAFTVGKDIFFNSGKFSPDTSEGKHLLAHELTHTIQQSGNEKVIQRLPQLVDNDVDFTPHSVGRAPWREHKQDSLNYVSNHLPETERFIIISTALRLFNRAGTLLTTYPLKGEFRPPAGMYLYSPNEQYSGAIVAHQLGHLSGSSQDNLVMRLLIFGVGGGGVIFMNQWVDFPENEEINFRFPMLMLVTPTPRVRPQNQEIESREEEIPENLEGLPAFNEADRIGIEIYEALDGTFANNQDRVLELLTDLDQNIRVSIPQFFSRRYGISLKGFLIWEMSSGTARSDQLIKSFALLSTGHWNEPGDLHVQLALALLTAGVRDREATDIIEQNNISEDNRLAIREELRTNYETVFRELTFSLDYDLSRRLSSPASQRTRILLERNLTHADKLYLHTQAIFGTDTTEALSILQQAWNTDRSNFTGFTRLVSEWNNLRSGNPFMTRDSLETAMRNEFTFETHALRIFNSLWEGYQQFLNPSEEEQFSELYEGFTREEKIRLEATENILRLATYYEWGTDEEQFNWAVREIRRIYRARIERARLQEDDTERERVSTLWVERNDLLQTQILGEMNSDTMAFREARLLSHFENLTIRQQLYVHQGEDDVVINLFTKAWQSGELASVMNEFSRNFTVKENTEEIILEHSYNNDNVRLLNNYGLGITHYREQRLKVEKLINNHGSSSAEFRGALRLQLDLTGRDSIRRDMSDRDFGGSESRLRDAYNLLTQNGISETLRNNTIARFVHFNRVNEIMGENTPANQSNAYRFLNYLLQVGFNVGDTYYDFQDLLDSPANASESLSSAEARQRAEHSGLFDSLLTGMTLFYDTASGEDSIQVTEESLDRLRQIAEMASRAGSTSSETEGLIALYGLDDIHALAGLEYNEFQERLTVLRELKRSIAEGVAIAIELAIEVGITILTGGAAAPALLASLSAAVAGMLVRESLLGDQYELTSQENLNQLIITAVSHGITANTRVLFHLDDSQILALSRAQRFRREAFLEGLSQAQIQALTIGIQDRMPNAQDVMSVLAGSLGAGVQSDIASSLSERSSRTEQLLNNIYQNVSQNLITDITDEVTAMASEEGSIRSDEIMQRLGRRVAGSTFRATITSTAQHAHDERQQRTARRTQEQEDNNLLEAARERVSSEEYEDRQTIVQQELEEASRVVPVIPDSEGDAVASSTRLQHENALQHMTTENNEFRRILQSTQLANDQAIDHVAWEEFARLALISEERGAPLDLEATYALLVDHDDLRRALLQYPEAARVFQKCNSPCFPEQAESGHIRRVARLIAAAEHVPYDLLNEYLYQHREELDNAIQRLEDDGLTVTLSNIQPTRYTGEDSEFILPGSLEEHSNAVNTTLEALQSVQIPFGTVNQIIEHISRLVDSQAQRRALSHLAYLVDQHPDLVPRILPILASTDVQRFHAAHFILERLNSTDSQGQKARLILDNYDIEFVAIIINDIRTTRPEIQDHVIASLLADIVSGSRSQRNARGFMRAYLRDRDNRLAAMLNAMNTPQDETETAERTTPHWREFEEEQEQVVRQNYPEGDVLSGGRVQANNPEVFAILGSNFETIIRALTNASRRIRRPLVAENAQQLLSQLSIHFVFQNGELRNRLLAIRTRSTAPDGGVRFHPDLLQFFGITNQELVTLLRQAEADPDSLATTQPNTPSSAEQIASSVGRRVPDVFEINLITGDINITDITLRNDIVHLFKTAFYVEVVKAILSDESITVSGADRIRRGEIVFDVPTE